MADGGSEQTFRDLMPVKAELPRAVNGVADLFPAAQVFAVKNGNAGKIRKGRIDEVKIVIHAAY
jgi:hypothetical protein